MTLVVAAFTCKQSFLRTWEPLIAEKGKPKAEEVSRQGERKMKKIKKKDATFQKARDWGKGKRK